jgi:competence protein ComEC
MRISLGALIKQDVAVHEAGMAEALITGKRMGITEEDNEAMRNSGLAHLISISGLHIGLVAGILFFFSRLIMVCIPGFGLRHPVKKYSALIALAGTLFYTLLCGAPIPTIRAMLMTGIVLVAVIMDRWAISMRLVVFAALVVLVTAPENLLSASFQMSFGAVAALVAFYEHYRPWISNLYSDAGFIKKIALYFLGVSATTLIAGTATEPFALYHFQQYALYGLLANFIAVPLTGFVIMPAAVLALCLAPFGLAAWPFWAMEQGIAGMLWVAHWVAGMQGAVFYVPSWPLAALLLIVFAALFVMFWRGNIKWAIAGPMVLASVLLILLTKQPDIMVSSSYDLISFRTKDGGMSVSTRAKDKFTLESWERLAGQADEKASRWHREGEENGLSCDEAGCRVELKGKKVAFTLDAYNLKEDCAWADIVMSPEPAKGCKAAVVVDRFDAWQNGAHAVWIHKNGNVTVKDVNEERGTRPWTVSNKR